MSIEVIFSQFPLCSTALGTFLFFYLPSYWSSCLLVNTTALEFSSCPTAPQFSGKDLALSQEGEVIDSFLNGPASATTLDTVNRFLSRLIALSMTFRYPSFCHIVLGSLPSVKVNQVRETRTGLLGFACVQRGRIPSVGGWTPFHSHLLFSSPSFLPSASSVTKQFCISNMGPGGSSFSSSFPFL